MREKGKVINMQKELGLLFEGALTLRVGSSLPVRELLDWADEWSLNLLALLVFTSYIHYNYIKSVFNPPCLPIH